MPSVSTVEGSMSRKSRIVIELAVTLKEERPSGSIYTLV